MHISDVVWASGITAAALLIQTALTNWRDTVRLNRDSAERQKDRDAAVADHWRDERLAAHSDYLAIVNALSIVASAPRVVAPDALEQIRVKVGQAWTRVEMLGSTDSAEAGRIVWHECQGFARQAMRMFADADPDDIDLIALDTARDNLQRALNPYRKAARRDIGTEV